ncbi:glycosyltransferase family 8 protein, partial [Patellaria atrata CBS 101060]
KYAYTTLLTRSSYLAGVIILAHTLHKQSTYPLYVLYTSTLDASSVRALELESNKTKLIPLLTLPLLPNSSQPISLIAERFADTWTKLRVFEALADKGLGKVCYLDADMLITGPIDDVFAAADLPDENWIAANHVCCCNLDADEWADADWTPENCPYTPLSHPAALTTATPVTEEARETYHLLNGGQFVFQPSPLLWTRILDSFNTSVNLAAYKFPDQDFLAAFFRNRFLPLPWRFNALKTMRYWHPNIWRDECVVCVHYIVDKPWAARVASDGRAGYVGKDGETHKWWWEAFGAWKQEREGQKVRDLV